MLLFVTSGKGGTGRSVISCNLAYRRALQGDNVCYVDFDFGSPMTGAIFGIDGVEYGTSYSGVHEYLQDLASEPERHSVWAQSDRAELQARPDGADLSGLKPTQVRWLRKIDADLHQMAARLKLGPGQEVPIAVLLDGLTKIEADAVTVYACDTAVGPALVEAFTDLLNAYGETVSRSDDPRPGAFCQRIWRERGQTPQGQVEGALMLLARVANGDVIEDDGVGITQTQMNAIENIEEALSKTESAAVLTDTLLLAKHDDRLVTIPVSAAGIVELKDNHAMLAKLRPLLETL